MVVVDEAMDTRHYRGRIALVDPRFMLIRMVGDIRVSVSDEAQGKPLEDQIVATSIMRADACYANPEAAVLILPA